LPNLFDSHASHLFLAAPMETPPTIIDAKRELIESLSVRLARGKKFSDLVAAASEDEATKSRGRDLGYFSAFRMPPDFFGAVTKLRVGQISPPIRTRLGFHIVQLTDSKPAQQFRSIKLAPKLVLHWKVKSAKAPSRPSLLIFAPERSALARRAGSRNANFWVA
jgi:parvulin-like peptidyl-prolyl isomerase